MTALSSQPHFTIPECPNCGAEEKAVAHWVGGASAQWFCFACRQTGTVECTVDELVGDVGE